MKETKPKPGQEHQQTENSRGQTAEKALSLSDDTAGGFAVPRELDKNGKKVISTRGC